ncbi:hypothetical protein [Chromatium okenii]
MVVADPNERKSSVDSLLTSSIKAWERKATVKEKGYGAVPNPKKNSTQS